MLRSLGRFMQEQFPENAHDIALNDPFLGGYIVRQHSKDLPWIQIELNRNSYLSPAWYDPENLEVCHKRIVELRTRLFQAIRNFVGSNCHHSLLGRQVA
jgi:N-formylglutamate amidohydrolase